MFDFMLLLVVGRERFDVLIVLAWGWFWLVCGGFVLWRLGGTRLLRHLVRAGEGDPASGRV